MIAERLADVRRRVAHAAVAAGRDPADVRLLRATKTQPVELVREAMAADARARADDPTLTDV
ncbi:MAG: YggS family pyridoxal phosphate-dependent enzyme, partial [Cellulomonas sp.]